MRAALASSIIIGFASQAAAQIVWNTPSIGTPIRLDDIHNVSSIAGTWSSGSQKVITGTVSRQQQLQGSLLIYHEFIRDFATPWTRLLPTRPRPELDTLCRLQFCENSKHILMISLAPMMAILKRLSIALLEMVLPPLELECDRC